MLTLLHVVFGTVALVVVPAALFARKGGRWHRRWGIAFTISMAIVLFSAGFLWQAKGHLFLVPLGFVTAYLLYNGWRVIARRRRKVPDMFEDRFDMLAAWAVIAAGVSTMYLAGTAATPLMHAIAPALIGVGGIAIAFGMNDLLGFRSTRMPAGWKLAHLSAMLAAYIAAVTAFLVINAHGVPMILRWAIPSAIGATFIAGLSLQVILPPILAARRRPAGAQRHRAA